MLDALTLDQLRVLVAIAEAGSFTAAARRVRRAQSAISHAVASAEAELGLLLFDRSTKRPRLTTEGAAVVADARLVLARAEALKARARAMAAGTEPELALAVTALFSRARLAAILQDFARAFPQVELDLFVEEIGGAAKLVHERACDLGIAGTPSLRMVPAGELVTVPAGDIEIVAVAAPAHPLARLGYPLGESDLAEHRQLVPASRARQPYPNTLVRETWGVTDLTLRRDLILKGVGWGTVPLPLVEEDLAAGRLRRLALATRAEELMRVGLFAIHRADRVPGPAGRWLLGRLGAAR